MKVISYKLYKNSCFAMDALNFEYAYTITIIKTYLIHLQTLSILFKEYAIRMHVGVKTKVRKKIKNLRFFVSIFN